MIKIDTLILPTLQLLTLLIFTESKPNFSYWLEHFYFQVKVSRLGFAGLDPIPTDDEEDAGRGDELVTAAGLRST